MKKIITLLLLVAATFAVNAQTSMVIRSGNTYMLDVTSMNKAQFAAFLQQEGSAAAYKFTPALKLSKTGWALFGSGLGLDLLGGIAAVACSTSESTARYAYVGTAISVIGDCLTLSGIVCLGVGYGRMHSCVDIYNIERQQKYKAQLNLTTTGNGLGFALAW